MDLVTLDERRRGIAVLALIAAIALAVVTVNGGEPAFAGKAQTAKKKCKKGKKSASSAKKKCGKKKDGSSTSPAPTEPAPLPLTAAEVIQRVGFKAAVYCQQDMHCLDSGYYFDANPSDPDCESRSTYTWTCYGWNDEDFDENNFAEETCDFREIVQRLGYNGVTGYQDLSFGGAGADAAGWECSPI